MSEWLGDGLQNRLRQFDPAWYLLLVLKLKHWGTTITVLGDYRQYF